MYRKCRCKSKVSRVIRTSFSYPFNMRSVLSIPLCWILRSTRELLYPDTFYFQLAIPVMSTGRKTQKTPQYIKQLQQRCTKHFSKLVSLLVLIFFCDTVVLLLPLLHNWILGKMHVQRDSHFFWVQTLNCFQILAISIISFQNTFVFFYCTH